MEPELMRQPESATVQDPGHAGLESLFVELETRLDAMIESRLDSALEQLRQGEREARMERFIAEHPDFQEMAASGALEAQKRDNPLLDDVGAYYACLLTVERQQTAETMAKTREELETQAEARAMERFRTKRLAQTLNAAPVGTGRGQSGDPDLAAPEKFGGINAVLAARLSSRRNLAGNAS